MERFLCIHGHFYQPPRESPWLESVEIQDSAYPYHDWNERITAECYAPNTASRDLDSDGRILGIVCNYARISFNFGPTLLSWMEKHAPDTHGALQAAEDAQQRSLPDPVRPNDAEPCAFFDTERQPRKNIAVAERFRQI